MRIVIVGAGVAGLYAAWHLAQRHEVILLEADRRLGGHADTHRFEEAGREIWVDSGFIVFNERHYPLLTAWFNQLGVKWRDSDMSFAVSDEDSGTEYNATSLNRLFCQRRNLFRPAFLGMVRDIVRFYRQAPGLLHTLDEQLTLGDWMADSEFGSAFAQQHLLPMASALWSAPMGRIVDFPMLHLLKFMDNHNMLQFSSRPTWRTLVGGSRSYVERAAQCSARIETGCPVRSVRRVGKQLQVQTDSETIQADQVILACHSDQALALLEQPSAAEQAVLGAVGYQANEVVLHSDISVLPRLPQARAAWNVRRQAGDLAQCRVSYYMNLLQGLETRRDYIVSLNQTEAIDPGSILVRRQYQHPVFTPQAVAAQSRWADINGVDGLWFCGAWWGWGFHEDGARSARRVVDAIDRQHG